MNILEKYGLSDRFKSEASQYAGLNIARIVSQQRGLYKIISEQGEGFAEISGKMRFETKQLVSFPTIGDFVMVSQQDENSNVIIHHVLTRKSVFMRKAVGVSGQTQPVAANIDTVFICMSLNQNFNLNRLERYLSVAWDSGAVPVIVLTKSDLCEDIGQKLKEVENVSLYSDIISLSMFDEDIKTKFERYLKGGTTSAFIGSSGVGKSTLINSLLGETVTETKEIGKADKGRHTTTSKEMFLSSSGGVLIDTPGMRELGADGADVSKTFDDIEVLAVECRFRDCTHSNEKGCAVVEAINNGTLDSRRFESFVKLKTEAGYEGLNSKQIEAKKFERFGGVKNLRKIGDTHRKIKHGGG